MSGYYHDDEKFRTGTGAETLEVSTFGKSFSVSIDSFDAPEQFVRMNADTARALAKWLVDHAPKESA